MKFKQKIYGSPFVNQHIAEVTGQHYHYRPTAWIRGDERYSYITGGMAMPTFEFPGYLLTIGVTYNTPGHCVCLDEYHTDDEVALIEKAQEIQESYGPGVIENWWGDPERLMPVLNETQKEDNQILISAPVDYDLSDAFQLYFTRFSSALSPRNKTLKLAGCDYLKNTGQAFIRAKGQKSENNLPIWVAGGLVHTILMVRPWEQAYQATELIPTTYEDHAMYEQEKAIREIERELYGEVI